MTKRFKKGPLSGHSAGRLQPPLVAGAGLQKWSRPRAASIRPSAYPTPAPSPAALCSCWL